MADDGKELERTQMAEQLAQANVIRISEVIAHAGNLLLTELRLSAEAERRSGRPTVPSTLAVTQAMLLANALQANEKNRATAFKKRPGGVAGPIRRVEMVRVPTPAQIAAAAAGAGGAGGDAANVGAALAAGAVERPAPVPPAAPASGVDVVEGRPAHAPEAFVAPARGADHVHTPEVITAPMAMAMAPAPTEPLEEEALGLAIEAAASTQENPMAAAMLRALAASRARSR